MKRKENFQWLLKELHQLKYETISVPQGSARLVKKTHERKSSTCYFLITKGVTSSSPVPLKTRRERKVARFNETFLQAELRSPEQAEREAAHRAAETPEQSQARRFQHATYMASQRDTATVDAAESRQRSVAERAQQ
ncbi:hypothetical protein TNCV_2470901 [Trichonephila clavipes]|nr:hypothetical protein TNCV_2470901 [Trichonephila clavipes]